MAARASPAPHRGSAGLLPLGAVVVPDRHAGRLGGGPAAGGARRDPGDAGGGSVVEGLAVRLAAPAEVRPGADRAVGGKAARRPREPAGDGGPVRGSRVGFERLRGAAREDAAPGRGNGRTTATGRGRFVQGTPPPCRVRPHPGVDDGGLCDFQRPGSFCGLRPDLRPLAGDRLPHAHPDRIESGRPDRQGGREPPTRRRDLGRGSGSRQDHSADRPGQAAGA